MISGVITGDVSGRLFVFVSTGILFTCVQKNARIFYAHFDGVLTKRYNNFLAVLAFIGLFALPIAGIFDTLHYRPLHRPFVILFFFTFGFYTNFIAGAMVEHRYLFPPSDQHKIDRIKANKGIYLNIHLLLLFTFAYYKHHGPVPYIEWIAAAHMIFFYMLVNTVNHYYDHSHLPYVQESDKVYF